MGGGEVEVETGQGAETEERIETGIAEEEEIALKTEKGIERGTDIETEDTEMTAEIALAEERETMHGQEIGIGIGIEKEKNDRGSVIETKNERKEKGMKENAENVNDRSANGKKGR